MTHPERQTSHLPFVVAIPQRRFYGISALRGRTTRKEQQPWRTVIVVSSVFPASAALCSEKTKWGEQNTGEVRAEGTVPDCKRTNMLPLPFLPFLIGDFGHV